MIGEFELIKSIAANHVHDGGIGDDCAILPFTENESLLVSTDMLIEDSHFLRSHITPYQLGHKTLAVNVSDIAAMGGKPLYCFLSWALPKNLETEWADEFFKGFNEHKIPLMGGDTTASKDRIALNVTIIGIAENTKIKKRSTAKIGDIICVTDYLGDSAAGLNSILQNQPNAFLIKRHYLPRAHIQEGQWLANFSEVHAMMDVSDGIASDLKRICEQSKCGANIDLDKIPKSQELISYCQQHGLDSNNFAAKGGEDYCLLLTIDSNAFAEIKSQANFPLHKIGKITPSGLNISGGFDHFA